MNKNKTVAVAMSGGIDSSAAAILLQEQGYHVLGITMLQYDSVCKKEMQAAEDAETVCKKIGIEHHVFEIKKEFKSLVIQNFINEYLSGRTPNPCVQCNPAIKWGELLNRATALGADFFATGHYCRLEFNPATSRYCIIKSSNISKDQSYALWRLNQQQLSKTLFPLGELTKAQAREIASVVFPDAMQKSESQEICFIEDDNYNRFILDYLQETGQKILPGNILDMQGKIIGTHRGFPFYTIGQRKGLGVAVGIPAFVTEIDPKNNTIRIGDKEDLLFIGLEAMNANYICCSVLNPGGQVTAHIRYNDPGYPALITECSETTFSIKFMEPRHSVTPGQSVVLYKDNMLMGGGIINRGFRNNEQIPD